MKNNFLISCYGRSGSKFLSTIMNKSQSYEVLHEPRKSIDQNKKDSKEYKSQLQDIFDKKNNYGEVNSYMRFHFNDITVGKKGIILRDPRDIITSVANRKLEHNMVFYSNKILDWYERFFKWVEYDDNLTVISFKKMTTDVGYINDLVKKFGIVDLNIKKEDILKKINSNKIVNFKSYDDVYISVKNTVDKRMDVIEKTLNIINE